MIKTWWTHGLGLMALLAASLGPNPARATQDPETEPPAIEGAQVLTQGPIHEAFAEPVLYEPAAGPVIAKQPPAPIEELPPDQKPEGDNVQWIPGYWGWDDGRNDYLWVSGVWRALPPGRQWVPGYWNAARGGFQWVPGYWSVAEETGVEYLPAPPASLENGPSSPAPSPDCTWAPGSWIFQDGQYAWRPGFWVQPQPNWVWTPAQYNWTPNGYVFNKGFWDYPLQTRGTMFAPVYFQNQSVYSQPGFRYTPGIGLLSTGLLSSLFVRPAYGSYYFGNYYAQNNFQNGIYPFYSFHQSRYGYDPLYAYAAARNSRVNPQWNQQLHDSYVYRRDHVEARPPGTYAELRRVAARPANGAANVHAIAPELNLARPINQIAALNNGAGNDALRYQKIGQARRQEIATQTAEVQKFRQVRQTREVEAAKVARVDANAARRVELPRSPVAHNQAIKVVNNTTINNTNINKAHIEKTNVNKANVNEARVTVPERPSHPRVDHNVQRPAANTPPIRHEPGPAVQPPRHDAPRVDANPKRPNPGAGNPGQRPNPGAGNPNPGAGRPNQGGGGARPNGGGGGGGRPGGRPK